MADQPVAAPAQTFYGIELFHDPRLNRSTAFPHQARDRLGLLGLVPEQVETEDMQLRRVLQQIDDKTSDLERYIFLASLHDTDETLHYRALMSDPQRFMPLVYTPTVGEACQKFTRIFRRPTGYTWRSPGRSGWRKRFAIGPSGMSASSW